MQMYHKTCNFYYKYKIDHFYAEILENLEKYKVESNHLP